MRSNEGHTQSLNRGVRWFGRHYILRKAVSLVFQRSAYLDKYLLQRTRVVKQVAEVEQEAEPTVGIIIVIGTKTQGANRTVKHYASRARYPKRWRHFQKFTFPRYLPRDFLQRAESHKAVAFQAKFQVAAQ